VTADEHADTFVTVHSLARLAAPLVAFALVRTVAAREVVVDDVMHRSHVGALVEVGLDASGALSVDDVKRGSLVLSPSAGPSPNFGVAPGTLWARFSYDDRRARPSSLVLEQADANADFVDVYVDDAPPIHTGDHQPFSSWDVRARQPAVRLPGGGRHEVLVALRGGMTKHFPLELYTEEAYAEHASNDDVAQGLYFGAVGALAAYNLFLFAATRLRVYGLYAATIGGVAFVQAAIHGLGTRFLWGEFPGVNDALSIVTPFFTIIAATLFFVDVLRLPLRRPRVARALSPWFVLGLAIVGLVANVVSFDRGMTLAAVAAIVWASTMLGVGVRQILDGDRIARVVVGAWLVFFAGIGLFCLRVVGLLPSNALTVNAMQVGSALEAVLLSLALADRIKELQGEVAAEHEVALANAQAALEAREAALRELEERRRLQGALDVATQHLTQAENMATLGMLMAGIAHDLRNPINYVMGAADQFEQHAPLLDHPDEPTRSAAVARVRKASEWVAAGARTMDALSVAMRNQSRAPDEDDARAAFAIDEVVREALLLCRSRTSGIELVVEVPARTVIADPTGVGQVVMNLVSNAADALREHGSGERVARVLVRALVHDDGGFVLEVHDSGPGVPQHVRARILEPFFTTKPRGQGTGLGLAIVQRVAQRHAGSLAIGASGVLGGAKFALFVPAPLDGSRA
jgi:two-component system NtrC family sensor kinase